MNDITYINVLSLLLFLLLCYPYKKSIEIIQACLFLKKLYDYIQYLNIKLHATICN